MVKYSDEHYYDDEEDDVIVDYKRMATPKPEHKLPVLLPEFIESVREEDDAWAERDCPVCNRHLRKKIHGVLHCECGAFHWL